MHDVPFACINVRITRHVPRYKFVRNLKEFVNNFRALPHNIIYTSDDPDEQLDYFKNLHEKPSQQPLRHDPDEHNRFFASVAERTFPYECQQFWISE